MQRKFSKPLNVKPFQLWELSEQRRKRLQELEAQLVEMKKKLLDQSKLLKLKESSVQKVSKLMQEIQSRGMEGAAARVKRRTLIISELESQGVLDTPLSKQVENLQTEMGLRNAQIADLQQKVLVADGEGRLKQRIDSLTSIVDAKSAVRVLMAELVSAKTACSKLESELKQEKGNAQDLRKMMADERNVMSTMDMEHQQQLVELEQRHQEKVLYLLNQLQNKPLGEESEETKQNKGTSSKERELLQRLKVQEEELEKLRALSEQNQKLVEQNEQYGQCACKGRCSNKQCRCRKGKMTCGENCQCERERCRNLDNQVTAEVLKEIGDMGHSTAELKLVRKPVLTEEDEGQEDDNEEDRTTISFLKKKKRLLTSFQNSFFSGCTPIREES
ncbi:hypothetical protein XENOCAPTIV_029853 [Xenoophorus captivus]|uniref:Tesmin/TSO1-like CXC domain-containing protein n=1 Tax=Xenoophorus captivus TaxID=1517983 RepID=A0ABV0R5L7_9TELE